MNGLIGKKIGMTSIYDGAGKNVACTVVEAGPCVVTQVKTEDTDGYSAVQLGFGEAKEKIQPSRSWAISRKQAPRLKEKSLNSATSASAKPLAKKST